MKRKITILIMSILGLTALGSINPIYGSVEIEPPVVEVFLERSIFGNQDPIRVDIQVFNKIEPRNITVLATRPGENHIFFARNESGNLTHGDSSYQNTTFFNTNDKINVTFYVFSIMPSAWQGEIYIINGLIQFDWKVRAELAGGGHNILDTGTETLYVTRRLDESGEMDAIKNKNDGILGDGSYGSYQVERFSNLEVKVSVSLTNPSQFTKNFTLEAIVSITPDIILVNPAAYPDIQILSGETVEKIFQADLTGKLDPSFIWEMFWIKFKVTEDGFERASTSKIGIESGPLSEDNFKLDATRKATYCYKDGKVQFDIPFVGDVKIENAHIGVVGSAISENPAGEWVSAHTDEISKVLQVAKFTTQVANLFSGGSLTPVVIALQGAEAAVNIYAYLESQCDQIAGTETTDNGSDFGPVSIPILAIVVLMIYKKKKRLFHH